MNISRLDVLPATITLLNQLCRGYPAFIFAHIPAVKVGSQDPVNISRSSRGSRCSQATWFLRWCRAFIRCFRRVPTFSTCFSSFSKRHAFFISSLSNPRSAASNPTMKRAWRAFQASSSCSAKVTSIRTLQLRPSPQSLLLSSEPTPSRPLREVSPFP